MKWLKRVFTARKRRAMRTEAEAAARIMESAFAHLFESFWRQASTRDRDCLIQPQRDALDIIARAQREALVARFGVLA
jgi:hypothetical protein